MASKKNKRPTKISPKKPSNPAPGTVAYSGKKSSLITKLDIIDYSTEFFTKFETHQIEDAFKFDDVKNITWININGLGNSEDIIALGNHFDLHPLIQADIVNISQRPKFNEYKDYLFIVFKMLHYDEAEQLNIEHISLVMGKDYVLTFQEAEGDVFNDLRERLENPKGRIRRSGSDYLTYAILDAVVDNYFTVIVFMTNKIELLEDQLFEGNMETMLVADIQELKKEIIRIRRAVTPLREVLNRLEKSDTELIDPSTDKYLRDLYDNLIQVNESIEIYREMIWGLMDMHMTLSNNKMNEIMKVLTIMASIFIPLTFLAGIYGMNFDNMPELHYRNSYFYLLGFMLFVIILMLWFFKRKKWL